MSCEEGKFVHGNVVEVLIRKQDENNIIRSMRVTGEEAKKWANQVESAGTLAFTHGFKFSELKWEILKDDQLKMFNGYQQECTKYAKYPVIGESFVYPVLGLGNEAGEVLGKIKKLFRDSGGVVTEDFKVKVGDELGDVLWYLAQVCTEFGITLEGAAKANIKKLDDRLNRGVLKGDGDNR